MNISSPRNAAYEDFDSCYTGEIELALTRANQYGNRHEQKDERHSSADSGTTERRDRGTSMANPSNSKWLFPGTAL